MPVPKASLFPKHERWSIVQLGISWANVRLLAKNIVSVDGEILNSRHLIILKDLDPDLLNERAAKDAWLKIWVTIVHTLGLAYTADEGTTIHATDLGRYITENDDPLGFYRFWAIRFQFPHGYPKQNHYIINGVCVQPIVLLLEYFSALEKALPKQSPYLSYDEVINFCMKRKNHDLVQTLADVDEIIKKRDVRYSYDQERAADGYESVRQNLVNRSKLYFEPTQLLSYETDKITLGRKQLGLGQSLLQFRVPSIPFVTNTEEARNKYIRTAFSCNKDFLSAISQLTPYAKVDTKSFIVESEEILEQQADEFFQKSPKTKVQLLKEARQYVPSGISHKRQYSAVEKRVENATQKARIKALEDFSCQVCGLNIEYTNSKGQKRRYTEAAHIEWKKNKGDESLANLIILCPSCHKKFDYKCFEISFQKKGIIENGKFFKLHHDSHLFIDAL